jgi:hypothetical protein
MRFEKWNHDSVDWWTQDRDTRILFVAEQHMQALAIGSAAGGIQSRMWHRCGSKGERQIKNNLHMS